MPVRTRSEASDEELVFALRSGDDGAIGTLYRRYVPAVFKMAAQSLGAEAAEDIIQEVFASVWQNAQSYDPERGAVRPWILQIARSRVLNELRRRSRKPASGDESDRAALQVIEDLSSQPDQTLWEEHQRSIVRKAIDTLPPTQRQALSLAFFEDLTHQQVADALRIPLGTTKTRIRAAMQRLRLALVAVAAVLVAAVGARFALRYGAERSRQARTEAALRMVTASDARVFRLSALPGAPTEAHGNYRTRTGERIAVLTFSGLPHPPAGKAYQAWSRRDGKWISLGQGAPDGSGRGLIVYEDLRPLPSPEALTITLEPEGGSPTPTGNPLIAWPAP